MKKIILMVVLLMMSQMACAVYGENGTPENPVYGENGGVTWVIWQISAHPSDYEKSFAYHEAACAAEIGGESGWRLPTVSEISKVGDEKKFDDVSREERDAYLSNHWMTREIFLYTSEVARAYDDGRLTHIALHQFGYIGPMADSGGVWGGDIVACVHNSLVSNERFTATHKICTRYECNLQEFSAKVIPQKEKVFSKKVKPVAKMKLNITTNEAEVAARAAALKKSDKALKDASNAASAREKAKQAKQLADRKAMEARETAKRKGNGI